MLESLSIEALAHYTRGMVTLFFILLATKFSSYRNRNRLAKIFFVSLCVMALGFLKDVIFLITPLMNNSFVMNIVSLIDIAYTPFFLALFFEATRPGLVTVKRLLLAVVPFVILIPIYIIVRNETLILIAYCFAALVAFVSFVLIMIYVSRYESYIKKNYSYTLNISVRWVGFCAIAYFSGFIVYYFCFNISTWEGEVFFDLFCIALWYVLAFYIHHHRVVVNVQELEISERNEIDEDLVEEDTADTDQGEYDGEETVEENALNMSGKEENAHLKRDFLIAEQLYQKMEVDKLYLDPALSLFTLAREIGSNRSYLSHYINSIGKTFYEYVNDYRVSESCRLIEETTAQGIHLPLTEVAQLSGFNSISSFNRHFYKIKSMTPSAYQRMHLMSLHDKNEENKAETIK